LLSGRHSNKYHRGHWKGYSQNGMLGLEGYAFKNTHVASSWGEACGYLCLAEIL
jgi:hypothetical protein